MKPGRPATILNGWRSGEDASPAVPGNHRLPRAPETAPDRSGNGARPAPDHNGPQQVEFEPSGEYRGVAAISPRARANRPYGNTMFIETMGVMAGPPAKKTADNRTSGMPATVVTGRGLPGSPGI